MSYQKWDIGLASISGGLSAAYNMIMFGGYLLCILGVDATWEKSLFK